MSGPEPKKPNLKPKADLAGWLDKLGNEGEKPAPAVKIVTAPPAAEESDKALEPVAARQAAVVSNGPSPAEITGTIPGALEYEGDGAITGTNMGLSESPADGAITGTDAGPALGAETADDTIEAGQIIAGQYEIICQLGRGGMSAVYKAHDLLMKRVVAVKCLHAHLLSDKTSIMRFQQEAQAAGNLSHPNIVKIHQYGLDQSKRPFLVMDYLEGQSLQELLDKGEKIPLSDAMRIMVEAASGLDQAHKKGVVHRDFKPSNVMLVNTQEEKNAVKIVDFGIAKIIAAPGSEGHNLTQTGEMLGSPNYMSPEQCMMMPLDSRSDIYAFGCTLYATFTGKAPFSSGNLVEIYYKHMNDLPDSISASRPDLKDVSKIDAVILKCMAKEPADRYQSMAEAQAAIQAIVDGGSKNVLDAFKDQLELNALKGKAKKTKKQSILALTAVSGLILTVGLGAYFSGQFTRTSEQNWHDCYIKGQELVDAGNYKEAENSFTRALESARSTGKLRDCVIPTMQELLDLSVIECDAEKAQKYRVDLESLKKQYESSFGDLTKRIETGLKQVDGGTVPEADRMNKDEIEQLCQSINDQCRQLLPAGYAKKASEILISADHLATKALDKNAAVQARTLHNLGLAYNMMGQNSRAYDLFEQSVQYIKTNISPSDPALIKDYCYMAIIDWEAGRSEKALGLLRQARSLANSALGPTSEQGAEVKVRMGEYYNYLSSKTASATERQHDSKLALQELRQAWDIYQQDPKTSAEAKARCLLYIALAENSSARYVEALRMQEEAAHKDGISLAWLLQKVGELTVQQPAAMHLNKQEASEHAVAYYKRALAVSYRVSPPNQQMITKLYALLNSYYFDRNQPSGMEPWYLQKISQDNILYGSDAAILVDDYLGLAKIYRQSAKLSDCEAALNKALTVAQKIAGDNNAALKGAAAGDKLPLFKVKAALAALNADRGTTELALKINAECLEILPGLSPDQKQAPEIQEYFSRYADLLNKAGKSDQARQLKISHKSYFRD